MLQRSRSALRYGLSVLAVGAALLCSQWCDALLAEETPFFLLPIAVAISAWYGGKGPGLVATALALLAGRYFFPAPGHSLALNHAGVLLHLFVFLLAGLLVGSLAEMARSGQRQAEASNRELPAGGLGQRSLLQAIIEGTSDAIYVKDLQGRYVLINAAGARFLGKRAEEVIGKDDSQLFSPETARQIMADDRKVLAAGEGQTLEEVDTAAGVTQAFLSTKDVYRDQNGKIIGLIGIARDVTFHRRAERRLAAQHAIARILAESATLGQATPRILQAVCESLRWETGAVWRIDREAQALRCIDTWHTPSVSLGEFLAASREASFPPGVGLPGRVWASGEPLWIPEVAQDQNFPRSALAAKAGLHAAFAFPIRLKEEVLGVMEFFTREVRRQPDDDLLKIVTAIGSQIGQFIERRRAEEELRESEESFRAVAENAPDGFITIDQESTILFANRAVGKIFGYTTQEMLGQKLTMLMPERLRSLHRATIQRYVETGDKHIPWDGMELPGLHKDSREIPLEISFSEFRKHGKHVFTGVVRDISERKRAQEERSRLYQDAQQANRAKDEFLAMLSHELRTPLNSMLGWARMLRTGKLDPDTANKGLEIIERNVKAQAQLISDLLDISRIVQGKLRLDVRPIELAAVVEAAIDGLRPAAEAKGIRLQPMLDRAAGLVVGDPDRLQQVFWNLLSNAIKFTPKDGGVEVQLQRRDSHVEVTVSDTGIGIQPDFLPQVFERFRQADASSTRGHTGLGLGLAIVRHLVELHGGTVRAHSLGEGKGATFIVSLPLAARKEAVSTDRVLPAARGADFHSLPSLHGVHVLVVDDEADARETLSTMLRQCGALVTTVASATEALQALEPLRPDLLISDIGMPAQDGYVLIRAIRALPKERGGTIPAVALTAYARGEDCTQALAAGFQMHLAKPVEPAELVSVVASLAGRAGPNGKRRPHTPEPGL